MRLRKILLILSAVLVVASLGGFAYLRSLGILSSAPVYSTAEGAIGGYDAVAYFTLGTPTPGSPEFTHPWQGAQWRFASAANRDLFAADPERYAPRFGGYCAYAVSENYTARTDPQVWAIVDDRLYLNFDAEVAATWSADRQARIARAEANWPAVLGATAAE